MRCVSCHCSVNITENRLVTLGCSEITGGYNTLDIVVEVGPRKHVVKRIVSNQEIRTELAEQKVNGSNETDYQVNSAIRVRPFHHLLQTRKKDFQSIGLQCHLLVTHCTSQQYA